jgi:hypothetical protein
MLRAVSCESVACKRLVQFRRILKMSVRSPTFRTYVCFHVADSDPGLMSPPLPVSALLIAVFPLHITGRPLQLYRFRGSIPSLTLRPGNSFPSASPATSPSTMRGSVPFCWLGFEWEGLAPSACAQLSWRTYANNYIDYSSLTSEAWAKTPVNRSEGSRARRERWYGFIANLAASAISGGKRLSPASVAPSCKCSI